MPKVRNQYGEVWIRPMKTSGQILGKTKKKVFFSGQSTKWGRGDWGSTIKKNNVYFSFLFSFFFLKFVAALNDCQNPFPTILRRKKKFFWPLSRGGGGCALKKELLFLRLPLGRSNFLLSSIPLSRDRVYKPIRISSKNTSTTGVKPIQVWGSYLYLNLCFTTSAIKYRNYFYISKLRNWKCLLKVNLSV